MLLPVTGRLRQPRGSLWHPPLPLRPGLPASPQAPRPARCSNVLGLTSEEMDPAERIQRGRMDSDSTLLRERGRPCVWGGTGTGPNHGQARTRKCGQWLQWGNSRKEDENERKAPPWQGMNSQGMNSRRCQRHPESTQQSLSKRRRAPASKSRAKSRCRQVAGEHRWYQWPVTTSEHAQNCTMSHLAASFGLLGRWRVEGRPGGGRREAPRPGEGAGRKVRRTEGQVA